MKLFDSHNICLTNFDDKLQVSCASWDYMNYSSGNNQTASRNHTPSYPLILSCDYQSLLELPSLILPFHLLTYTGDNMTCRNEESFV